MNRRMIAFWVIILLFVGVNTSGGFVKETNEVPTTVFDGNILYVGGSGPNNYTKIQDAINDSIDSDTVFVYDDSSPYNENLIINKSINLIGEDADSTVIDGILDEFIVNISSDNVIFSDFTVQYQKNNSNITNCLIFISSNSNIISGNIIASDSAIGIKINHSDYNFISGNKISCTSGIHLNGGNNNNISGNLINNSSFIGIYFDWSSDNNSIYRNKITNNLVGIVIDLYDANNTILLNNISYNGMGIYVYFGFNCKIIKNNFISNLINAGFIFSVYSLKDFIFNQNTCHKFQSTITWDGNYWNKGRVYPKIIFGRTGIFWLIPFFNFDWNPASEPYNIEV